MIILTVRTDKPQAEIGLFSGHTKLGYETWEAHRELSVTIHHKIEDLLKAQGKTLHDIQGIACFKGPGSFTGLRIGLTVGNALAEALRAPIVATPDPDWLKHGITRLLDGENERLALPNYGTDFQPTPQKK